MSELVSLEVKDAQNFLQSAIEGVYGAANAIKELPYVQYDEWLDVNPGAQMGFSIYTHGVQTNDFRVFLPEVLTLNYEGMGYRLNCNVSYGKDVLDEQGKPYVDLVSFETLSDDEYTAFENLIDSDSSALIISLLNEYQSKVQEAFNGYKEPLSFIST